MFSERVGLIKPTKYKNKLKGIEVNKMKSEKKELIKKFRAVVEDLLDNYEEYTEDEKAQIKDLFQKVADLNTILDKYDVETRFDWTEYLALCSQCFDGIR